MNIQDNLLTINPMSRPGLNLSSITKIVVHYVGNPGSQAIENRNYFESLKNQSSIYASSQYIIGLQGEIIRCIPENEVAWHAGNYAMNLNSIGIENCHPDTTGKFNDLTYNSLIELLADLCKRYNLNPYTDIIRHYDVTGKKCPLYYVNNIGEWDKLKQDVSIKINGNIEESDEYMEELRNKIANLENRVTILEGNKNSTSNNTQKYTVTAQGVNVRQAPDLNAKINKLYYENKNIFEVLEDNGTWVRCVDGWIKKSFVRKI